MRIKDENEALEYVAHPDRILDAETANECIGFINGWITDYRMKLFDLTTRVDILFRQIQDREDGKTIPQKKAEYLTSELYVEWRKVKMELSNFRDYRHNLKGKEEDLRKAGKFISHNYENRAYLG